MMRRLTRPPIAVRLRRARARLTPSGLLALLFVLALGVEPMLCIMHCTFWVPLSRAVQTGHHMHGAHRMPDGSIMSHSMAAAPDAVAALDSTARLCLNQVAPRHSPMVPSAQAFHEFTLARMLLLGAALLLVRTTAPPRSRVLLGHAAQLLRPPISLARCG